MEWWGRFSVGVNAEVNIEKLVTRSVMERCGGDARFSVDCIDGSPP